MLYYLLIQTVKIEFINILTILKIIHKKYFIINFLIVRYGQWLVVKIVQLFIRR